MSKTKSMRGEEVDFDLHKMKSSMSTMTITDDVKKRERFVNAKRRRTSRKKTEEMVLKSNRDANYKKQIQNIETDEQPSENIEETVVDVNDTNDTDDKKNTRRKVK